MAELCLISVDPLGRLKNSSTGRFDAGAGARAPFRNEARSTVRAKSRRRVDKVAHSTVETGDVSSR